MTRKQRAMRDAKDSAMPMMARLLRAVEWHSQGRLDDRTHYRLQLRIMGER